MSEKKSILSVRTILFILIIAAISIFGYLCYYYCLEPGPPQNNNEFSIDGSPISDYSINDYPVNEVWENIVEMTGINNSTASLDQIFIKSDKDGTIESFNLYFYGQNGSQNQWYRIESVYGGNLTITASNIDEIPKGIHPLDLLVDIEKIPYNQLACEDKVMTISIDSQTGDLGYDSGSGELFLINKEKLVPLKRIVFHTDEPFYDITICCNPENNTNQVHDYSVTNGSSTCYCLFTSPELEKAEIVEYMNQTSDK